MLIINQIIFKFLFFITYAGINITIRIYSIVFKEKNFITRNSTIIVIKNLLNLKKEKFAKKIYSQNHSTVRTHLTLFKAYVRFFWKYIPNITTIINPSNKELKQPQKGIIYISFHFIGNFEIIVYWLSTQHDELYIIYSDTFFNSNAKQYFNTDNPNSIGHLKYLTYYNKNFKIFFLNFNQPDILYKIIHLLRDGKKILMIYDEFPKVKKDDSYYFKYKINNHVAARVPKTLFYILKKTNCQLIPIVNIKKNAISNQLNILGNIDYNYELSGCSFVDESERVLKNMYDFLIENIKNSPKLIVPSVWLRFYHFVKSSSDLAKIYGSGDIQIEKIYQLNGSFKYFASKRKNIGILFRVNDLKCAKVNFLAIKIMKSIERSGQVITSNIFSTENKDMVFSILGFLLREGFIIEK